MVPSNTIARSLNEIGLAAWFGGSLMGAVGVNGAAAEVDRKEQRARVANAGWNRWTPVNALAIGAHLVGSVGQLAGNRGRVAQQQGVAGMSTLKTLLTAAALGVTAYSRALGQKVNSADNPKARSGTKPTKLTKAEIADAMDQLDRLQWVVPALTGALVVVSSYAGEQQRASEVIKGVAQKS